jgi:hypothetical protein
MNNKRKMKEKKTNIQLDIIWKTMQGIKEEFYKDKEILKIKN